MSILITICGRGGSKGIPGKNIKIIGGKSLIAYTIEVAKKFAKIYSAEIELSTDSEEIKKVASEFGLNTQYTRPEYLATDSMGKLQVIKDIIRYSEKKNNIQYDIILDLDITSPLRSLEDLVCGLEILVNDENSTNLFSVSLPHRNPYFNMVEQGKNGYYNLVKKIDLDFFTRQSAPKVYDMNASFYFYKRSFFEKYDNLFAKNSLIYLMPHLCFDLDESIDFDFMEFLLVNNKLSFEL